MKEQATISNSMKAAGLYTVLGILPSLISIFTLPIYLKHFSVAEYGALALLQFYGTFFGMAAALQLNAGASITYFDHNHELKSLDRFKSTIFTSTLVVSAINFLLFLLIGHIFFNEFLSNAQVSFYQEGLMVMGSAVFGQVLTIYLLYQRNEYRLKSYMGYTVTSLLLTISCQYFLIVEQQMGITGSILGSLLASASLVTFMLITNSKLIRFDINLSLLTPTLKLAIPLIPLVFLEWFFSAGARLFVEKLMTLEDVGKVSLIVTFMLVTIKLFASIWSGFTPELLGLMKYHTSTNSTRINQLVTTYLKLGLLILSGAMMLGCNLSLLTDNPKFLEIVPLIPLASLALLPKMLTSIPTLKLMFEKRSKTISLIMSVATMILIIGFLILIPNFGLNGIIVTFLIANLINLLLRAWQCLAFSRQALLSKPLVTSIGVACVLVTGILFITITYQLSYGLFGIIQFAVVVIGLGYLSRKELAEIIPTVQLLWTSTFQKTSR